MKIKTCLVLLLICFSISACELNSDDMPQKNQPSRTPAPPTPSPAFYHPNQPLYTTATPRPTLTPFPTRWSSPTPKPKRIYLDGKPSTICDKAKTQFLMAHEPIELFAKTSGSVCLPIQQVYSGPGDQTYQEIYLVNPGKTCDVFEGIRVSLPVGDQTGQMKQLPGGYTGTDVEIYTGKRTVQYGEALQVSGLIRISLNPPGCWLTPTTIAPTR